MFVDLGDDWFVNLDYVAEVAFETIDQELDARVTARTVDESDVERLMIYHIRGDAAHSLLAALKAKAWPR